MATTTRVLLFCSFFVLVFCQQTRPNIVFILTDDQDSILGGMEPMVKTRRLLTEQGMTFDNMFVSTPLCCPSRASILTGQYLHNTRVVNNSISGNCSSPLWQRTKERFEAFAPYLRAQRYRTFFAGKYLNQYGTKPSGGVQHVPAGWDEWHALVGNSRYYDYTLSVNGTAENHGHNYEEDYLTDVIGRKAGNFLNEQTNNQPFFMMLSTPSCHDPVTPAPQYQRNFTDRRAPRTPTFNTHARDKHWIVEQPINPMLPSSLNASDWFFRNRWRTLLSVDDMISNLIKQLESKGVLNTTYIFFTSDNGYHLGQFSLPRGKLEPYEFDIRVPLIVRGPGIRPNTVNKHPVMNIDLAPTFLDLIGLQPLATMDGKSLLPLLFNHAPDVQWRQQMLIEYQGMVGHSPRCPSKDGQGVDFCDENCICMDAGNNTYSCIRRLQGNDNFLYCEFKDDVNFREFYDIISDPNQITNIYRQLPPHVAGYLRHLLARMRTCRGGGCDFVERTDIMTSRRGTMTSQDEMDDVEEQRTMEGGGTCICRILSTLMKNIRLLI